MIVRKDERSLQKCWLEKMKCRKKNCEHTSLKEKRCKEDMIQRIMNLGPKETPSSPEVAVDKIQSRYPDSVVGARPRSIRFPILCRSCYRCGACSLNVWVARPSIWARRCVIRVRFAVCQMSDFSKIPTQQATLPGGERKKILEWEYFLERTLQ